MSLLPPPPWKLQSGYLFKRRLLALVLLLAGIAIGSAYGIWQWDDAANILATDRLWKEGDVTAPADVSGDVTTRKFLFNSYKLKVVFDDEAGRERRQTIELDTLGSTVDQNSEPLVRYRRGDPDHVALNWAVDVSGGRWASFVLMFGMGVFVFGGGLAAFAVGTLLAAQRVQAAAATGVEVECEIVSATPQVVNGRQTGNLVYEYQVPAHLGAPPGFTRQEITTPKAPPILLDGGKRLLAIISPSAPKHPLVVRADLAPLAVDEATRLQVAEQAARRG
jgi:hypothetical protein